MASVPMEISGSYSQTLHMPAPEDSGFWDVTVPPWEGVESVRALTNRATNLVRRACPLGTAACEAQVNIEKPGIRILEACVECAADLCPIDDGMPAVDNRQAEPLESAGKLAAKQSHEARPKLQLGHGLLEGGTFQAVKLDDSKE